MQSPIVIHLTRSHCLPDNIPLRSSNASASATPEQRFLSFVRTGDQGTIQALIQEYAARSYNQARRIIGRDDGAEDAVQEAYVLLVTTAKRYDGSVPFVAWLARLVNSAAIGYRRRLPRHKNFSGISDQGAAAMNDHAEKTGTTDWPDFEALRSALDSLPERYRNPLNMHYFGGLDLDETAAALGIPARTIETQLGRGLDRLRDKLLRAGFAVTSAGVISLFTSAPSFAASPAFLSSLTAVDRMIAVGRELNHGMFSAKNISLITGAKPFFAAIIGVIVLAAAATAVTISQAKIAPPLEHLGPLLFASLEAENMPMKPDMGGAVPGGWELWANGSRLAQTVEFGAAGSYRFEITAKGTIVDDVWPIMDLSIDQDAVGTFTVESLGWKTFICTVNVAAGEHQVAVEFMNDFVNQGLPGFEHRDLVVDKIVIYKMDDHR
jgi:RNA polymerase sigma-70 factor (ECF subfamily)